MAVMPPVHVDEGPSEIKTSLHLRDMGYVSPTVASHSVASLQVPFPSFLAQALQRKSLGRLSMLYVSDEGNFKNLYFASGSLHLQMGCIELDTPEHGFSYPTMVSSTPKPENTSAQLAPKKQTTIPISWVY